MNLCSAITLPRAALVLLASVMLVACGPDVKRVSEPLPQRCYAWQRQWTGAVSAGFNEAQARCDGLVLLGCEIMWNPTDGHGKTIRANLDWQVIQRAEKPISLALRVAPMKIGMQVPEWVKQQRVALIIVEAQALLAAAEAHHVVCRELQIDYDSAQRGLGEYAAWLKELRSALPASQRLIITALPSWLGEAALPDLLSLVDGYVLQVHSVPTFAETGRVALCDTAQARRWVNKAVTLRRPFEIALPTYRCLAGFDAKDGHSLGLALDGVEPQWPPNARVVEYVSNAGEIAALVNEWKSAHSPLIRGLLWYRMPVHSDARNWRWPTLAAVMDGRKPKTKLQPIVSGNALLDVELTNEGESDDRVSAAIEIVWQGGAPVAAEALRGWRLQMEEGRAVFTVITGVSPRLPPGSKISIGWLRFAQPMKATAKAIQCVMPY